MEPLQGQGRGVPSELTSWGQCNSVSVGWGQEDTTMSSEAKLNYTMIHELPRTVQADRPLQTHRLLTSFI